jgi:hypothetical protein
MSAADLEIAGEERRQLRAEGGLAEAAETKYDEPALPAPVAERFRSLLPPAYEAEA